MGHLSLLVPRGKNGQKQGRPPSCGRGHGPSSWAQAQALGTRQGSAVAWLRLLVGSEGPAVGTEVGTMRLVGRLGQGGGSASRSQLPVVSD